MKILFPKKMEDKFIMKAELINLMNYPIPNIWAIINSIIQI